MDERQIGLPDPAVLASIEDEFWTADGRMPPDASSMERGAPISPEKFFAHAVRQAREYSLRGSNMASVSVDLVLPSWPLERILAQQLATFTRYATSEVADLQSARFEVLATGEPPHADVVLPSLTMLEAARLSEL